MGGFTVSPSPSPQASEDEGDDDGFGDDNDDENENTSSSGDEEMTASQWLASYHSWQKGGVLLGMSDEAWLRQSNGTCPDGSKFSLGYLYEWGDCFYEGGHRCGVCHNAFDVKVKTRNCIVKWNKMQNGNQYPSRVSIISVPCVGSVGGFIYVALDSSSCD